MKKYLLTVPALLLWTLVAWAGPLKDQVITPFVEVRSESGLGSGTVVMVCGQKLVLTAGHVVQANIHKVTETHWDGTNWKTYGESESTPLTLYRDYGTRKMSQKADIVAYSPPEEDGGHDLALLKPKDPDVLVAAEIDTKTPLEEGQDAWYVGSPSGLHASLEKTIINKLDHLEPDLKGSNPFTIVNGHGWHGNSGGGVFVRRPGGCGVEPRFVLVAIIVRAASDNPKTPILCQTQVTIAKFLSHFCNSKSCKGCTCK